MSKKTKYILLAVFAVGAIAVLYVKFKPKFSYYKTEKIPNTNLHAVIYLQDNFKSLSIGSSDGAYALSYIELQDLKGNTIAKQNWFTRCEVQIGELRFSLEKNKLYFTKFSYIDLTDYKYYCFGNGM